MNMVIRITVVFCLLIGVVFLGLKIYKDSAETDPDQARRKALLMREIDRVKKEVEEKRLAMEKAYRKARGALGKVRADQGGGRPKKALERGANPGQTGEAIAQDSPPFGPLDQEDSKLTSELLERGDPEQGSEREEGGAQGPIELDQVSRIRELYSKTIEVLDGN